MDKILKSETAREIYDTCSAFRAGKAMAIEDAAVFLPYLQKLEQASGIAIGNFRQLLDALQKRHDFFHEKGCRHSDHSLEIMYATDYTSKGTAKTGFESGGGAKV